MKHNNTYTNAIHFLNLAAEHRAASDEAERGDYPTACALLARADSSLARAILNYEMSRDSFADRSRLRALIAAESYELARARRFLTGEGGAQ